MLIIEMAKIELTGGHIGFCFNYIDYQNENQTLVIIEMEKIEINWRPY